MLLVHSTTLCVRFEVDTCFAVACAARKHGIVEKRRCGPAVLPALLGPPPCFHKGGRMHHRDCPKYSVFPFLLC